MNEKNLTPEQIEALKNNLAWMCVSHWMEGRKEDIKNRLLTESAVSNILKLQNEYDVYNKILNKVKNLGRS